MTDFRYLLRLPWPNLALDREDSAQISKNLEQFLHFGNFLVQKQDFLPYVSRHVALAFARSLKITKTQHFWIWHEKLCFPTYGQEIWAGFEPSKRSKTLKNDVTAPILTHRK